MEEIIYQKSYQEYKAELDGELQRTAEGFVKIGYLLKVARDTNVLAESGYKSVAEFAEAEYSLNKTQVSRFISINDKFSEGGYSDHLMPGYQGFGYAKLTIMLQLPEHINEELNTSYSKAEIQTIKDEMDAEGQVSEIERYMETPNESERNLESTDERSAMLYKTILQLGEDDPELYVAISEKRNEDLSEALPELMAPTGDKMYSIRVRGIGRMMISISEVSDTIKLINSRSGEKESYSWADMAAGWIYAGAVGFATENQSPIECWEQRYERKYPVVAPVQPQKEEKKEKKEQKKPSKVEKAPKKSEWKSAYTIGQQVKVIASDHIGELVEKTDKNGRWKLQFATYSAEHHERDFTEYLEEPDELEQETTENLQGQQSQEEAEEMPETHTEQTLHDVNEDIPEPSPMTAEPQEMIAGEELTEEEEPDPQIEGQETIEEYVAEALAEDDSDDPDDSDHRKAKAEEYKADVAEMLHVLEQHVTEQHWLEVAQTANTIAQLARDIWAREISGR